MNLRNVWNYVRLHRVALAIPLILTCLVVFTYALLSGEWWLAVGVMVLLFGLIWRIRRPYMQWLHEARGMRELKLNNIVGAEACFRHSLAWANSLSPNDPCRGRVLALLTLATQKQGHCDDAEGFARDWREAEESAWGRDHPRAAHAMEVLAEIYDLIARHHQARPLLESALRVRVAHERTQPLEYVQCLDALGSLWCRLERYEQAEPYFRKALDIARARFDPTIPETLVITSGLSKVCVHLDRLDEADALAVSALSLAEKHPDPVLLPVAYCLSQLAYVRRFQDRFDEADELLGRSMAIVAKAAPGNAMALHGDLHLHAVILRYQSRWSEAEDRFREVLRLRQEFLAPEDLSIARVLEDYADLLELMGRTDEAAAHQNHAKQIRDFHSPFRLV